MPNLTNILFTVDLHKENITSNKVNCFQVQDMSVLKNSFVFMLINTKMVWQEDIDINKKIHEAYNIPKWPLWLPTQLT